MKIKDLSIIVAVFLWKDKHSEKSKAGKAYPLNGQKTA